MAEIARALARVRNGPATSCWDRAFCGFAHVVPIAHAQTIAGHSDIGRGKSG